mmetsp:Transcript_80354/g.260323  ORF Transcript_80354/g.260323 Transcript_80354/m.260323 type:complete len:934 (-) Transcript_80354:238-3039(-)
MGCCGTGDGDVPANKPLDKERYNISEGPLENRRCTDFIWIIVFVAHWVCFVGVTILGLTDGNPQKLYSPRDYRGDYCGVEKQWNSDANLKDFGKVIFMMNTSKTVELIAKQLVCSSAAQVVLETGGALSPAEWEQYMCSCCKTPCRACSQVLPMEDLTSPTVLADTVSGKMLELTDSSRALSLFSGAGKNGGSFRDVLRDVKENFVRACTKDCSVAGYASNNTREYRYGPTPDAPWKKAWDVLLADTRPEYAAIRQTIQEKFTFRALPRDLCPYAAGDCVPFPGFSFQEVASTGYCMFQVSEEVNKAMGNVGEKLESADLAGRASETVGSVMGDILESLDVLAIVGVAAIVVSLVYLVLLRFFVNIAVWTTLFLVFALLVGGSGAAYVRSGQCSGTNFVDAGTSYGDFALETVELSSQSISTQSIASGEVLFGSEANLTLEEVIGDGSTYRGHQTKTRSGRTCQHWGMQFPHNHSVSPAGYPNAGLAENYCRNPIGSVYIWCFTTDPTTRWELCNPLGTTPFDRKCPEGYVVPDEGARKALEVSSMVLGVLALLWLVVCLCLISRIRLAIAINKVAAKFVYTTPQIILVPLLQAVVGILWCGLWAFCAAFLLSQVPDGYTPKESYATYAEAYGTQDTPGACTDRWPTGFAWKDHGDNSSANNSCSGVYGDTMGMTPKCWRCAPPRYAFDMRFAFSFFAFLWNNAFMVAVGQTIIAGACAVWFFAANGSTPVSRSVRNTCRYHLGSLAFGSFIIAVVMFVRWWLYFLQKQAEQQKNRVMACILRVTQCCLACFERFLKFLTKNAYIQVAIMGTDFCTSAKNAFFLILRNAARFGALTILGSVLELIGFMVILSATSVIGYFVLDLLHPEITPLAPMVLYVTIGYLCAKLFISVYSLAVDAMLQCFIAAEELDCAGANVPLELRKMLPGYKPGTE